MTTPDSMFIALADAAVWHVGATSPVATLAPAPAPAPVIGWGHIGNLPAEGHIEPPVEQVPRLFTSRNPRGDQLHIAAIRAKPLHRAPRCA